MKIPPRLSVPMRPASRSPPPCQATIIPLGRSMRGYLRLLVGVCCICWPARPRLGDDFGSFLLAELKEHSFLLHRETVGKRNSLVAAARCAPPRENPALHRHRNG